jgi:hypothetical protein
MQKTMDKVSADHQDNTFCVASAMLAVWNVSLGFVLTVGCFGLIGYGSLALYDWMAG